MPSNQGGGFHTDPKRTKNAITAYQLQLTHYTSGVTGNLEIAREIVQEAFMRFWKTDDKKVPSDMEKPWLYLDCRIDIGTWHWCEHGIVQCRGCVAVAATTRQSSRRTGAV